MNPRRPLFFVCLLLLIAGLDGCCGQQICDCFSEEEDRILLRFDLDSLHQGFRRAETRGTYVVRFAQPGFGQPIDTVRENAGQSGLNFYSYGIALNYLFKPLGSVNGPVGYSYAIVLPALQRRYQLTDLELAGEMRGDRCCQCYRNTHKRLRLDGVYIVADGAGHREVAVLRR